MMNRMRKSNGSSFSDFDYRYIINGMLGSGMKFELLHLLARFRGLFPDNQKGTFVFGKPDKNTVRQMYYSGGFVPYRIDSLVTYR